MPLSEEQKAIRATGVGASEASAIVGVNPYRGALDIWVRKPTPSRAPIVTDEESPPADDEISRSVIGDALEPVLCELYHRKTGIALERPKTTLRHPRYPHVLASPDGLARGHRIGGELKVVGSQMEHHWADDLVPAYVTTQAVQCMAVLDFDAWDVVALVGGTDFRVYRIERDLELEEQVVSAVDFFWRENVLADDPPPAMTPDERRQLLLHMYPGSTKTACAADEAPETAEAMRWLATCKAEMKRLAEAEEQLEAMLCERVGDRYGIETSAGKFLWYPRAGSVSWKAVAEELAGGVVPVELSNKHRGKPTRVPALYPIDVTKTKAGKPRARRAA